ncbi:MULTISPECIES: S-layer homology domain-containing protein [unclassified Paenibacillus]|uniref:S-layer homology domain-containing protein n=1 Tax=unclassified Paenibacillus TaxID=185978 RepID=UPI000CFBC9D4|nr:MULTISPECIES: S-layer homology domain-containing protein [unclassified Paenibacillus]PRA00707.1 S-layer protein [Paenibacillus sp. MYb63]PRA49757.1 S-layer protein [Paenibacillus sp. MYb67]QZN75832.1 S-layer homology domain-containing protein [Paenibacillus sp. DR312]
MKKQIEGHEKKKKRNVWIVGLVTTAVLAVALLPIGPVHLTSTANAASGTSDNALSKFKDIKGHWAQATIAKAYEKNLISGYQDGTFRPNGKITRGEYATILARATGLEKVQGQNPFADLKGHWSEAAVSQLVGQGFINAGDYAKGFNPNAELTRYEMMKWIANGLIKSGASFQDAFNDTTNTLLPTPEVNRGTIRAEQIPYLALVRGTGIVGGFQDGTLKPADSTTRAEVSAILLRYMDVEGTDAGKYSDLNEMREVGTTGTNLTTVSNYKYIKGNFGNIVNTEYTLKNNVGVVRYHRFIVVDTRGTKPKGLYASLFVDQNNLTRAQGGRFSTYAEITFTSKLDKSNLLTVARANDNIAIPIQRLFNASYLKEKGFITLPDDSNAMLKQGVSSKFWSSHTLDPVKGGYMLKNDAGKEVQIYQ